MTLHTVGPETVHDDERAIGKAYMTWAAPLYLVGPVIASHYLPAQDVAFVCVGLALVNLHEIGGRLHDLCIRARRTNILIRTGTEG
jgi:hypothetical protein